MATPVTQVNHVSKTVTLMICIILISILVGSVMTAVRLGLTELDLLQMMICGSALIMVALFRGIAARGRTPI